MNTTSQGEKMTEKTETKRVTLETIAEWRAEIENDIESWGKDYKGMAREDLHGREIKILDALEAMQAELAALRGQVGGVVPELTEDDLLEIYRACKTDLMEAGGRASLWAAKRISEWFRRLTSSRVAGEGEVVVSADLLILVDKALESCRYTPQHVLREAIQSALRAANEKGEGV